MAEHKLLADGREALPIGRAASRFAGLERNDRVPGFPVLVEVESRAEDKTDGHPIGGA
jgi:hypothetical protein